jgi:hypothetical protein
MNIFYLDPDPEKCAAYHNDRHCVKMILESCQLLSNALPEDVAPYKRTHTRHPASLWVQKSIHNWLWLHNLTMYLFLEWKKRYNHENIEEHACYSKWNNMTPPDLPDVPFLPPPQCMPDDCKCDDTVQAYRNYYIKHKGHLACWKNGKPEWYV